MKESNNRLENLKDLSLNNLIGDILDNESSALFNINKLFELKDKEIYSLFEKESIIILNEEVESVNTLIKTFTINKTIEFLFKYKDKYCVIRYEHEKCLERKNKGNSNLLGIDIIEVFYITKIKFISKEEALSLIKD